jgi:hypothetical protein
MRQEGIEAAAGREAEAADRREAERERARKDVRPLESRWRAVGESLESRWRAARGPPEGRQRAVREPLEKPLESRQGALEIRSREIR